MHRRPQSASLTEPSGQVVARDGQDPLGLLDLLGLFVDLLRQLLLSDALSPLPVQSPP
jgi:hypothetical protein